MSARTRRRLGRVLVASLQRDGASLDHALGDLRPDDEGPLVELALHHRVGAELLEALGEQWGPRDVQGLEEGNLLRHLRCLGDLDHARDVLAVVGAPWLVMKGPVLAERYRARPGHRGYADLDILVERAAFPACVGAFQDAGFRLLDRNWEVIAAEARGQLHLVLPFGTELDLHWDVVNRSVIRDAMDSDPAALLGRRRDVALGGVVVPTLGVEDTILHLLLHAGLSGANRLVWLRDVERVVAVDPPQWDVVVRRATDWRIRALAGTVLERSRGTLAAAVPAGVVDELLPGAARRLTRIVDRLSPPEAAHVTETVGGLWARTQRDTLADSLVEASAKGLRGTGLRRAIAAWRTGRSPAHGGVGPFGALRPSGDGATRARYLTYVASGAWDED